MMEGIYIWATQAEQTDIFSQVGIEVTILLKTATSTLARVLGKLYMHPIIHEKYTWDAQIKSTHTNH